MTHANRNTPAHRVFTRVAADPEASGAATFNTDGTPEPLRQLVNQIQDDFRAGNGTTCLHQPTYGSGRPVLAASWRPGLYACERCSHLLIDRDDVVRDLQCDACGRQCLGANFDDPVVGALFQFGDQLLVQVAVCTACAPASTPLPQPPAKPLTMRIGPRGRRGKGRGKGKR